MNKNKTLIIVSSLVALIAIFVTIFIINNNKRNDIFYEVTFDTQGGSVIENQSIKKGEKIETPKVPTKEEYEFIEWQLNGLKYDFNSPVTSNIELVAVYEKIEAEIPTNTKPSTTQPSNNKPNNNGNNSGNTSKPSQPETPAQPTTPTVKKYTITFDSNGESVVNSQTINEGNKVSKPKNPTKTGYNFSGWLLNGSNYDFNSSVTSNITLVAKWTKKSYVVKVSSVDQYSPDRILTVYEDGIKINVSSIKYNGTTLCNGSNMVVNMYEINGISSVTVVLTNGTSVTASVQ